MFVKNDKGRMWVNGTIGVVEEVGEEVIKVKIDEATRSEIVDVPVEEWENIRYELDPKTHELKRVDLPAPLRPSSATISCWRTSNETSARMWLLP